MAKLTYSERKQLPSSDFAEPKERKRWWEFDVTYQVIRVMSWLHLSHSIVRPDKSTMISRRRKAVLAAMKARREAAEATAAAAVSAVKVRGEAAVSAVKVRGEAAVAQVLPAARAMINSANQLDPTV